MVSERAQVKTTIRDIIASRKGQVGVIQKKTGREAIGDYDSGAVLMDQEGFRTGKFGEGQATHCKKRPKRGLAF